ncbi:hypothetical protein NQZ68_004379 [Dissostichus eleginoides]|nr:hypothetical protein NQZ68_004379 [Dissostichus eleginoides]
MYSILFASPSTPVVFNWQIDSAVCKPDHLQETPDRLVVKCQSYETPSTPHVALARCPGRRTDSKPELNRLVFAQGREWECVQCVLRED